MKKWICLLLIACLLTSTLIGCSPKESDNSEQQGSSEPVTVRIAGLKGPTSIGMIRLFEEKPSLGENVDSVYEVAQSPDVLVSKLLSQEVDFATLPTNTAAQLYNKDGNYQLAAISIWGVLYLLTEDENIQSFSDLKGKQIESSNKGTTPDVLFRYLLQKNGLDPESDVALNYDLPHVELAQSMAAGKIETAVLPEPFATMVTLKNENVHIALDFQEEWRKISKSDTSYPQTCLVVNKDFAQTHPDIVKNFLEHYKASIDWMNENPAEAGTLVEKHDIGLQAKMAEKAIPRCNMRFESAEKAAPTVEEYLNMLLEFSPQDIGGKLPDENFYYIEK